MCKQVDFSEYEIQIKRLIGEDVKLIFKGTDTISISPILIECFDVAVFPRKTTFIYDWQRERMSFHKEDISDISMSDDEDDLSFCITFSDKSYIIIGKADE